METATYRLKVILETELLGSQTTRKIATEFLAKKSGFEIPDDEIESLPEALERATTVFHRDEKGEPVLWDYQIKGFLKESARLLSGHDGLPKNLRAKVGNYLFISPRCVALIAPDGDGQPCSELIDVLERPLRAQTALGERVAIASSELLPAGVWFGCGLTVILAGKAEDQVTEEVLRQLLDYGFWKGLLQWRSGGYGRFRYELVRED